MQVRVTPAAMVNEKLWTFWQSPRFAWVSLLAIALFAGWLRLDGLQWDDRSYPHPDERFNTMVASQLHGGRLNFDGTDSGGDARRALCKARNGGPEGVGGWFDTQCSDFNPANIGHPGYPYGPLPLATVRLLAELAVAAGGPADLAAYGGIALVGRAFSAACDVLALIATFFLGRLAWGTAVGLLAAAFYAVAVLPIQAAHFWTVDTSATLFATVALVFLVRIARFGQKADALAFGVALGLGLACKISIAPLLALLPLALYWAPAIAIAPEHSSPLRRLALRVPELTLAILGTLACFRLASPHAFAGPAWTDFWPTQSFFEQIQQARRLASGAVDFPPNWQWLARTPWVDPARNLLLWGLGPVLGGAAAIGVVGGAIRLLRATRIARARSLVWLWAVGYFVWMGQQWVASMRYFLPIYPALCVLAAAWLVPWWRRRRLASLRRPAIPRPSLPAAAIAAVVIATTVWALAFHHIHVTLHPYVAATHWILRHVEAPVSARIESTGGVGPLVNWPLNEAPGGAAADATSSTRSPADGTIARLRLHRVTLASAAAAPTIRLDVLDRHGRTIATTATVALPFTPEAAAGAVIDGVDLPLVAPAALIGGEEYGLRAAVRGGSVRLSGARIIQEGPWNDAVPTRVARLSNAGAFDPAGASGTVAPDAEGVDPFGQGYYTPLSLDMATEDEARKRTRLLEQLDAGEWLVVPNQRFYDSMPRNPLRFPLATRFYDALFGGELGYSVALVAASPPTLMGIAIADQALPTFGRPATNRPWMRWMPEEAFSVYDHPAVFVFRKDAAYRSAAVERALGGLELTDVKTALGEARPALAGRLAWSTAEANAAPDGILRAPGTPRTLTAVATADGPATGIAQAIAALQWYVLSLFLGVLAWPWLATLWPELPDRGYGAARIAGLVALAWPAWWLASLGVPAWTPGGLAALLAVFSTATALRAWSRRRRGAPMSPAILRNALVGECAFALLFVIGIGLRLANPDLWAPALGGEKPMDFAMFNRVLGTGAFPPADPWFSGGRLNYYYFGWVLAGVMAKLTGTPASLAYNLALPTWFAMTGLAAGALAFNAVAHAKPRDAAKPAAWIAAAVALAATVLLGNLDLPRAVAPAVDEVRRVLDGNAPVTEGALRDALQRHSDRWFWAPSRTVGERPGANHEINEFPAFSFVFGDLHAHVLALPLQLLALCALGAMGATALAARRRAHADWRLLIAQVAAAGAPVGLLRATNTWDWPLYLAVATGVTTWVAWDAVSARTRQRGGRPISTTPYLCVAGAVALLLSVQWLVSWPFRSFVTGAVELSFYTGNGTPLVAWLAMHGWFLVAIGSWALALTRARPPMAPARAHARTLLAGLRFARRGGIAATVAVVLVASFRGGTVPAVFVQVALVAWLIEVLWLHATEPSERAGLLLAIAGFALAVAVEAVVVGRDIGRMNTFFKFHVQAWLLLAIASGIAIGNLVALRVSRRRALLWKSMLAAVTLVAAAYLPLATYGRSQARFDPGAALTLDGEAFLDYAVHDANGRHLQLADDAQIIRWLRANTAADDVILEAQLPEYQWGSRLSTYSGRSTVLGYRHHQTQQRPLPALNEAIELRRQNVPAIYETTDLARKLAALRHYGVSYVAVGGLERAVHSAAGLAAFDALVARGDLEVALALGEDRIYRVRDAAAFPVTRGPAW